MVCPKCGNKLADGNMYCEICGEEIMIVPDFEPEIENSMIDALSDVVDHIEAENKAETEVLDELKKLTQNDGTNTKSIKASKDVYVIPKSVVFKAGIIVVALILIAFVVIGINIYQDNSYDYQLKCGDEAKNKGLYEEAVEYYEKAYKLNKTSSEAIKRIALVYENYENTDKAEQAYRKAVEFDGDLEAVEALINLYINDENYNEAYAVLYYYGNDSLKEKYNKFAVESPVFSLEEGVYDEMKELVLSVDCEGSIYYTLDGAEPGSDCNLYEGPIILRNGNYKVNAICVNDYGVCSQAVLKEYDIRTNVPDAPIVNLADGTYDVPQLIRITVPLNSNVYYTTDGSEPGVGSAIYTDPIAIPTGQSVYKFIAVNELGNTSEVIVCKYDLEVDTVIDQQQAIELVKTRQFENGRVADLDGNVTGSEGKYMYAYSELRYVQNRTLYFISEYYQEGTIRMATGNMFAVDVYDGHVYQAVAGSNNTYTLVEY